MSLPAGYQLDGKSSGGAGGLPAGYKLDGPTTPPQDSEYSFGGLAKNILPDIGRNVVGVMDQIKQGAYEIPKALAKTPVQLAQGTPYDQTDLGQYVNQTAEGAMQGLSSFANDPIGAMYRNPVTTGLAAWQALDGAASPKTILRPETPPNLQPAVQAARELNIPLTRAEQTGSPRALQFENLLEKTPRGSKPIDEFRQGQANAINAATQDLSSKLGTTEDYSSVGIRAKQGLGTELGKAKQIRNELYDQIPQDVTIPLHNSRSVADQLVQEQSQYLPITRNGQVTALAEAVQQAHDAMSGGQGVAGGFEMKGMTTTTPEEVIPPSTKDIPSSLLDAQGKPLSYKESIPGKTIPESQRYDAYASASPETSFQPKPNYPAVNRLRSMLGSLIDKETIIKADGSSSLSTAGRDFARLKSALDSDIEAFANAEASPLDSMIAKEFKRSYQAATANAKQFAGTYQNPDVVRMSMMDPEKIVGSIFKKNNLTEIQRFKASVGEEAFNASKQRFTQDLLESKDIGRELGKYDPAVLKTIYPPKELAQLQKLVDAKSVAFGANKVQGAQGSARSNVQGGSSIIALSGLKDLFTGNFGGAAWKLGQYALPGPVAKMYLDSSNGVKVPFSGMGQNAAKAALMAAYVKNRSNKNQ